MNENINSTAKHAFKIIELTLLDTLVAISRTRLVVYRSLV